MVQWKQLVGRVSSSRLAEPCSKSGGGGGAGGGGGLGAPTGGEEEAGGFFSSRQHSAQMLSSSRKLGARKTESFDATSLFLLADDEG